MDLPGLLLAVLGVAVLLGLLWTGLLLQLADLLGLEVAVLLLHWEGEDVGEFLAISVNISLAHFYLDLSGDVVAVLLGCSGTDHLLLAIAIVLGGLLPLAVELDSVSAGDVVDDFLLHEAVRCLHVAALIVILGGGVDLVGGVADPVLPSEAPLDLVGLLQRLVVDGLHQAADQLVHIEADTLHICLDHPCTVLEHLTLAVFLVLGPASLFCVGLALVLKHHLLNLVAVGVLVGPIAPHIGLTNIRVVLRSCCPSIRSRLHWRFWVHWRRRFSVYWRRKRFSVSAEDKRKAGEGEEEVLDLIHDACL